MNCSPLLLVAVLGLAIRAAPVQALEAVCLPDRAEMAAGESATIRVSTDAPAGVSVNTAWSVGRGTVVSTSDPEIVVWRPGDAQGAPQTITAHLTAGAASAICTAQIIVLPSPQRGSEKTIVPAALLLPATSPEPPGYGLYSYVLFAHRPQTAEERERMELVLKAVLGLNGAVAMEKAGVARSQLNATILPIDHAVPSDFDQRDDRIAWLRNNYGYERALKLLLKLHAISGNHVFSPSSTVWVVSCLHPLDSAADPHPVLVQDLSAVPVRMIGIWATSFSAVTTQPRLYDRHSLTKLSLDLRIVIAQAGDSVEAVRGAFKLLGSTVLD